MNPSPSPSTVAEVVWGGLTSAEIAVAAFVLVALALLAIAKIGDDNK